MAKYYLEKIKDIKRLNSNSSEPQIYELNTDLKANKVL